MQLYLAKIFNVVCLSSLNLFNLFFNLCINQIMKCTNKSIQFRSGGDGGEGGVSGVDGELGADS